MRTVIVAEPAKCYACLSCVVECAYSKSRGEEAEPLRAKILSQSRLDVEEAEGYAVPLVCHHCEDAPCLLICPTRAVYRASEDGPVLMDQAKCIGCKACILACPFGMARLSYEGRVAQKCDRCMDRLGPNEAPVCVRSCPSGALRLAPVEEVIRRAAKRAAEALVESEVHGAKSKVESPR